MLDGLDNTALLFATAEYNDVIASLRNSLEPEIADSVWTQGSMITIEQATELALQD